MSQPPVIPAAPRGMILGYMTQGQAPRVRGVATRMLKILGVLHGLVGAFGLFIIVAHIIRLSSGRGWISAFRSLPPEEYLLPLIPTAFFLFCGCSLFLCGCKLRLSRGPWVVLAFIIMLPTFLLLLLATTAFYSGALIHVSDATLYMNLGFWPLLIYVPLAVLFTFLTLLSLDVLHLLRWIYRVPFTLPPPKKFL